MNHKTTASSLYFKILYRIFEYLNIDKEDFKKSIGLNELIRSGPRCSAQSAADAWSAAAQYSGRKDFGLISGRLISITDYGMLSYVLMNCENCAQILGLVCKYKALLCNSYIANLDCEGEYYKYSLSDTLLNNEQLLEFDFSSIIHLGDKLIGSSAGRKVSPMSVSFQHDNLAPIERYEEMFACPVKFNQPENFMLIHKSLLEAPLKSSSETNKNLLLNVIDKIVSSELHCSIEEKIRLYVRSEIQKECRPVLSDVAKEIGCSSSTLKRTLAKEDLTYKQILDEILIEYAQKLLSSGGMSTNEVAMSLGFSSSSSFIRFYKKATGKAP